MKEENIFYTKLLNRLIVSFHIYYFWEGGNIDNYGFTPSFGEGGLPARSATTLQAGVDLII